MNRIELVGNLTKDPEFLNAGSDKEFMVIRVASNHKQKNGNEETIYLDVVAFRYAIQYAKDVSLVKGDKVSVSGRLRERSWKDDSGNVKSSVGIVADSVYKIQTSSGQGYSKSDLTSIGQSFDPDSYQADVSF